MIPLVAFVSALNSMACHPSPPVKDKDSGSTGATTSTIGGRDLTDVIATNSDLVPNVFTVTWTSPEDGDSYVEYGLDDNLDQQTPIEDSGNTHSVVVLGIKEGRTYSIRAVTITADGTALRSDIGTINVPMAPEELGRFTISVNAPDQYRPAGYILTSQMQAADSFMIILDRDGDIVWYYKAPDGFSIPTTKPGRNGQSLLFTQNGSDQKTDVSTIQRIQMDGSGITTTRALLGHHSFVELPGNKFAWIGLELRKNVTTVLEDGTEGPLYLAGDTIYEIDEGAGDADPPTEVFNYFDDWGEPYWMCSHFDALAYQTDAQDWTHANSLMYLDDSDDLFIMSKNLDQLTRIDASTGQILWQIGGRETDYTTVGSDTDWWSHGHMSYLYEGGFIVFDNGYHHDPVQSRVMAYTWDDSSMTVNPVFQYTDPQGRFIQLLGDGRWLDNGNYLTSWTTAGILKEITPDGQVVWEADTDLGTAVGRVTYLDDLYTLSKGEMHADETH